MRLTGSIGSPTSKLCRRNDWYHVTDLPTLASPAVVKSSPTSSSKPRILGSRILCQAFHSQMSTIFIHELSEIKLLLINLACFLHTIHNAFFSVARQILPNWTVSNDVLRPKSPKFSFFRKSYFFTSRCAHAPLISWSLILIHLWFEIIGIIRKKSLNDRTVDDFKHRVCVSLNIGVTIVIFAFLAISHRLRIVFKNLSAIARNLFGIFSSESRYWKLQSRIFDLFPSPSWLSSASIATLAPNTRVYKTLSLIMSVRSKISTTY